MKRLLKFLFWLAGGLLSLLVVAVVVVPLLFNPNDHKQRIAEQITRYTGLSARIEGDIGLTVFPWLGVTMGVVELGQAPGFAGDAFARTGSMQVRVKLLPLLGRQLEMDTVSITGLELNLARDADGRGNWQTVMDAVAAAGGKPEPAAGGGPPALAVLAIGGLDLRDASIRWNDAVSGQIYTVSRLSLETGALDLARPIKVALAFDVDGGAPRVAGHVTLDANVSVDANVRNLTARDLRLGADLPQAGPLGEAARATLAGQLALAFETQAFRVDALRFTLEAGRVNALGGPAKITLAGDLGAEPATRRFTLGQMDLDADLGGSAIPGGKARLTAKGDLTADLAAGQIAIAGLQGELADIALLGAAAGMKVSGDFAGNLETQVYDLAGARFSGAVSGYPGADSRLNFDGGASVRVDATARQIAIADLGLDLPGLVMPGVAGDLHIATSLAGDYGAARYVAKQFALEGKLSGDAVRGKLDIKLRSAVEANLSTQPRVTFSGLRASGTQSGFAGAGSQLAFDGGANAELQTGARKLALSGLSLDVSRLTLPGLGGQLRLAGDLSGDYGKGRYTAKQLALDGTLSGDKVGGEVGFKLASGLAADLASGALTLPGFRIDGDIAGADIPGGKLPFKLAADIAANLNSDRLDVAGLKASAGPLKASGEVRVDKLRSAPSYSGRLALASFNARKLLELLGQPVPDTADRKALTDVSFEAGIAGTGDKLTLDPFRLGLDGSSARGRLQMIGLARPAWRFDIDIDQLDADRYLPPQKPGGGSAATPGAAAGAAAGLPVETLRALDAQGELRIGSLKLSNMKLADIVVRVEAGQGLVRLAPLAARLYDGRYDGNVSIDARGAEPQIAIDERLTGVRLGALLRDLKRIDTLAGVADVQLRANAVGASADAIKRTLNGNAAFRIVDGEFRGIDIASTLCGLVSGGLQALGGSGFQTGQGGSTRFSDLTGSATVSNGVVVNPDLLANSPLLRLDGRGQANLVSEQIDYTATANLVGSCQGQGGLSVAELSGIAVPVRVTGSFAKPQYGIDPGALLQVLAKSKLQNVLQKSLGLPVQPQTAPAAPAPSAPSTLDSSRGLPPAGGATSGSATQPTVDPKKKVIEGVLKGLFGN